MKGYYSVFDPTGKKIADCGFLKDATNLVCMRGEGHYYQFKPCYEIVDVTSVRQLPTSEITVNMDGGVGGSWKVENEPEYVIVEGQKLYLQQSNQREVKFD